MPITDNEVTFNVSGKGRLIGTGNGFPWNRKIRSAGKGDNLFLCSIVALDSKRAEFFLQAFGESGTVLGAGRQVAPAQLQSFLPPGALILAGDAAALLAPLLAGRDVVRAQDAELPDPALIARLALSRFGAEPLPPPLPLYLRPPDTTLPQAP